jgi:flagellar biosynthesis regulator FlaF
MDRREGGTSLYFEHDHAVRICAEEVLNTALRASKIVRTRFGKIKITIIEEVDASKSDDKQRYIDAVEETNKASREFWSDMRPIVEILQNSLRAYLTAVNKFLREGSEIP